VWYVEQETSLGSGVFNNHSNYLDSSKDTYSDTNARHEVNTLTPNAPMDYTQLWFTAATKAGQLVRYPFRLKICGDETLVANNPQSYFVFDKWTGTPKINGNTFRTSDDSLCPIKRWDWFEKDTLGNYIPYVSSLLTALVQNPYLLQINTTTSFQK
jgi:hypothetical protein